MIASEARIAANRRNSLLSTGPRTEAGKERSRSNGLKHGLCAAMVVPEDPESIRARAAAWAEALAPANEYHAWLVDQAALMSLRVDRSGRMERGLRDRHSMVAELDWEGSRKREAEDLGGRIQRKPAQVIEALRQTPQGCEWLMGRWALLAHAADSRGAWTADQVRLAFDLLATPPEFRDGPGPGSAVDSEGRAIEADGEPAAVARREIAALKERRTLVEEVDAVDRALAMADLSDESNAELKRLRRYEATLQGRIRWCLAQLRRPSTVQDRPADEKPTSVIGPCPEPVPSPEPEAAAPAPPTDPPVEAEVSEDLPPLSDFIDDSVPPSDRLQKREDRAASRRQAKLRKLDRRRA